jgi:hypothetical protein
VRRRFSVLPALIASLMSITSTGFAAADVVDKFSRIFTLSAGTPIQVEATIADLTITGSSRSDLAIDIVRRAPTAAHLAKFPVKVEQNPDGLRLAAVQENEGRDSELRSEIAIVAPASAVFQAVRVFEGRVRVSNLKNRLDVDLRRGAIEASGLAGSIRLETGIGSIDVRDSELTSGGMMRLRVFNGPLRVRFARPPQNARILALTFNGTITSDIPLNKKEQFGPRFGETTLGSGDPVMSMDVVKGDIVITVGRK